MPRYILIDNNSGYILKTVSEMAEKFRLNIYTHEPMTGAPAGLVMSEHNSVAEAVAALESHSDPYAYAYLLKWECFIGGGWYPANFDGTASSKPDFRYGANRGKDHPALSALKSDWNSLAQDVANKHQTEGVPLVIGSAEILSERHPQITGMAEKLAEAAYAKL